LNGRDGGIDGDMRHVNSQRARPETMTR